MRDRQSYEFALTSAAVALHIRGGVIREAKVAAGGVGTVPWKLPAVEQHLVGERPSEPCGRPLPRKAADGARPLQHNRFKVELLKRTVERQLRVVGGAEVSPQPQAAVGAPLSRVDGRLKVTGKALYAAEHDVDGAVHAVIVDASIGRGRITAIDTGAAEAHPGVLKVIHHRNAPKLPYRDNSSGSNNPRRTQAARLPGRPGPLPRPAGRRRGGHHAGGRAARREPGEGPLRSRTALDRPQRGRSRTSRPATRAATPTRLCARRPCGWT